MTDATHITDEMLTRWMSGQAAPDEEAAVLDYIAESDEHLDELLTASASVRLIEEASPVRRVRPLWPAVSVAASVALLLGIGAMMLRNAPHTDIDAAPSYAAQDTLVEPSMEDTL